MAELFVNERVMLNDWALPQYPHLKDLVGRIVDERRLPPFGRQLVTKWQVGSLCEFKYMQKDELHSAEGAAPAPMMIKAISLWQPWAWLVALGEKQFETRHWSSDYRGLLAIHAAKRWTKDEQRTWESFKFSNNRLRHIEAAPPLGAILCVVRIKHVFATEQKKWLVSRKEQLYGNWQSGRFAWELEMVKLFDEPIPAKGAQGFFNWTWPQAA